MSVQAYAYPSEEPDLAEFERFWRHMHGRLQRFVLRALDRTDADEIVQETMIRCYENWTRLDPQRDPWPWLVVVARRISADHVRARARREAHAAALATDEGVEPALDEHVCARELTLEVQHALRALPEHDRTVLAMHHFDELSTAQIAELTGRTDNAVRQQLFRARRRLGDEFRRLTAGAGAALAPLRSWLRRTAAQAQDLAGPSAASIAVCLSVAAGVSAGLVADARSGDSAGARPVRLAAAAGPSSAASDRARVAAHRAGARPLVRVAGRPAPATSGGLGGSADPSGTVVVTKTGDPLNDPHHASSEDIEIYLPGDPEPIYARQYRSNTPADDVICLLPNVKCPAP